jgi:SCY1-like protein 1
MASSLPPPDYTTHLLQPLVRMFASPDRAMRLALLEGLPSYADKLENKVVVDKVWPHLVR